MTKYNELVDHLVSNMKGKRTPQDVTNSSTDWEDFWYNSDIIHPSESNTMRPPFVPKKVSNNEAPFNTPAYSNYQKSLTKKERKSFDELYKEYSAMSIPEQITNLKVLGRELVIRIDDIIDKLDVILNDDFDPNKVTCSVDNKEVDCDTWDEKDNKS